MEGMKMSRDTYKTSIIFLLSVILDNLINKYIINNNLISSNIHGESWEVVQDVFLHHFEDLIRVEDGYVSITESENRYLSAKTHFMTSDNIVIQEG